MGKSILLSIRPKWCELILSGKKVIEIRKSRPKIATPFKCYIYCTKGTGRNTLNLPISQERLIDHYVETGSMDSLSCPIGNGKVIGEFICDTFVVDKTFGHDDLFNAAACLNVADIAAYFTNNKMYGWHISDLVVYDKPKELIEFQKCPCKLPYDPVLKPPQSWCYVEELEATE